METINTIVAPIEEDDFLSTHKGIKHYVDNQPFARGYEYAEGILNAAARDHKPFKKGTKHELLEQVNSKLGHFKPPAFMMYDSWKLADSGFDEAKELLELFKGGAGSTLPRIIALKQSIHERFSKSIEAFVFHDKQVRGRANGLEALKSNISSKLQNSEDLLNLVIIPFYKSNIFFHSLKVMV